MKGRNMKIQNNSDPTIFGNKVIIKYSQLRKLGDEAVKAAEGVKPRLETRGENMKYVITRAYRFNPDPKDTEFMSDILLPTDRILISAKKINVTRKQKIKNFFRVNLSQEKGTPTYSERALMRVAKKAEKKAKNTKSINIFKLIFEVLTPPAGTGPR